MRGKTNKQRLLNAHLVAHFVCLCVSERASGSFELQRGGEQVRKLSGLFQDFFLLLFSAWFQIILNIFQLSCFQQNAV